jgi:hypothetical protein
MVASSTSSFLAYFDFYHFFDAPRGGGIRRSRSSKGYSYSSHLAIQLGIPYESLCLENTSFDLTRRQLEAPFRSSSLDIRLAPLMSHG